MSAGPSYEEAVQAALRVGTLHLRVNSKFLGSLSRQWVTREFVLREGMKACVLLAYKRKTDEAPVASLALEKDFKVIPKLDGDKHGFILLSSTEEYTLYAANKKESSAWILSLESAISLQGPTKPVQQRNRRGSAHPTIKEPETRRARNIEKFYDVADELGSGGFATVKRGINKETQQVVALKIIPRATYKKAKARTDEEIMVLTACAHDNIMRLFEVVHTESSLVMVLELLSGGELFDRIVAREKYTENDARMVVASLFESVAYLHSHGIVHRDLKPENLIFDRPGDDATLKLTDFGFATIMEPNKKLSSPCGTPEYVAPEVLSDRPYDQSADMWSCGVITYILLCGYPPFYAKTEKELFQKILTRKFEFHHKFWYKISPEAIDLINKLLELNPLKRLTAKQALQHPWLKTEIETGDDNMSDVLIQLKRYNAARKFKRGVLTVIAANRLNALE
eukprot:c21841_g1_i1.p1 GENE.c21841_g1_i1~~c21841_g1_i1.p1  ORF type:complete len:454 (+),score=108.13 c21841_g1_i1:38-1399(+)